MNRSFAEREKLKQQALEELRADLGESFGRGVPPPTSNRRESFLGGGMTELEFKKQLRFHEDKSEELNRQVKILTERIKDETEINAQLNATVNQLQAEKSRIESENMQLTREVQTLHHENDKANAMIHAERSSVEASQNQVETLTILHKEVSKRCDQLNHKIRDLEATLLKERQEAMGTVKADVPLSICMDNDERTWWQKQREEDRASLDKERQAYERLYRESQSEVKYLRDQLKREAEEHRRHDYRIQHKYETDLRILEEELRQWRCGILNDAINGSSLLPLQNLKDEVDSMTKRRTHVAKGLKILSPRTQDSGTTGLHFNQKGTAAMVNTPQENRKTVWRDLPVPNSSVESSGIAAHSPSPYTESTTLYEWSSKKTL